jgi:hypothetical protein
MKRAWKILSVSLAALHAILWLGVSVTGRGHFLEIPSTAGHRDYIEGRRSTPFQLLLASDSRGVVFDVFVRQNPPEKAPGPPGSEETQRWLRPRAERTAAAYARRFGFEKGILARHGQSSNDPLYFYGIDYYVAVPHLLLIILFAWPAWWPLRHRWHNNRNNPQSCAK